MFVHDLIKIKFIREGYLPNYPYHMISDSEMCDAFINFDTGRGPIATDSQYFYHAYPLMKDYSSEVTKAWKELRKSIVYHLQMLKYHENLSISPTYTVPDWVYSYMIGSVIGPCSETLDIHDLILPLGVDNIDDIFGAEQAQKCYEASRSWINKSGNAESYKITKEDMERLHLPSAIFSEGDSVKLRPATMFGEPHVIKSLRVMQA
ncbi:MAG: hypothetical protein NC548_43315 [Lachnospiraceae bacterium]|nr:hypothetical protein [Lachnospiraceae bacterium]MCM1232038.1 hypothetical protein [Ruminococcus flavefaciens]